MSLKTLPVDGGWVQRMVDLASGPWERARIEKAFVSYGWASPGPDGGAQVEWGGGPCAPQSLDGADPGLAGWYLELGEPPDGGDSSESFIRLPCALFWPAFGAEDDGGSDEDDIDEDYPPAWRRHPDARRADFHAEYDRLGALLRDRLGEPDHVLVGEMDEYREIWRCGEAAVVLHRTDDISSYSQYDVIMLCVCSTTAELAMP